MGRGWQWEHMFQRHDRLGRGIGAAGPPHPLLPLIAPPTFHPLLAPRSGRGEGCQQGTPHRRPFSKDKTVPRLRHSAPPGASGCCEHGPPVRPRTPLLRPRPLRPGHNEPRKTLPDGSMGRSFGGTAVVCPLRHMLGLHFGGSERIKKAVLIKNLSNAVLTTAPITRRLFCRFGRPTPPQVWRGRILRLGCGISYAEW